MTHGGEDARSPPEYGLLISHPVCRSFTDVMTLHCDRVQKAVDTCPYQAISIVEALKIELDNSHEF